MSVFITQCPHCETSFNITQEKLELANGKVRCGYCLQTFSAQEHRLDFEKDEAENNQIRPEQNQSEQQGIYNTLEKPLQYSDGSFNISGGEIVTRTSPENDSDSEAEDDDIEVTDVEDNSNNDASVDLEDLEKLEEHSDTENDEPHTASELPEPEDSADQIEESIDVNTDEDTNDKSEYKTVFENDEKDSGDGQEETVEEGIENQSELDDAEEYSEEDIKESADKDSELESEEVSADESGSEIKITEELADEYTEASAVLEKTLEPDTVTTDEDEIEDLEENEGSAELDESENNQYTDSDEATEDEDKSAAIEDETAADETEFYLDKEDPTGEPEELINDQDAAQAGMEAEESIGPFPGESLEKEFHDAFDSSGEESTKGERTDEDISEVENTDEDSVEEFDRDLEENSAETETEKLQAFAREEVGYAGENDDENAASGSDAAPESDAKQEKSQEPENHKAELQGLGSLYDDDALNSDTENPVELSVEEPIVIHQHQARSKFKTMALFSCNALLLILLASQFIWGNLESWLRDSTNVMLTSFICNVVSCPEVQRFDLSLFSTDELLVNTHPTAADALQVDFIFRNSAAFEQALPLVELNFTDLNRRLIANRLFRPEEYLDQELTQFSSMPPNSSVQVRLEITDPGPSAINYSLALRAP